MKRSQAFGGVAVALLVGMLGLLLGVNLSAGEKTAQPATKMSPFGIGSCHVNNRTAEDNARWIPQMAAIGVHEYRTAATGWSQVELEEGKWNWTALDKQMKYLEDQGLRFGAMLNGNAKWNKLDAPGSLPVNNLKAWSKYASELAKHVQGRVKHFEIWNEPPNGTGRDQTPADYAKIVVAAHDAIKAVDPNCLVGIAAKSVHVNYLEQAIKAGAKDHFDYVVLHPYEVLNGIADNTGSEAVYMNIVPTVRKMLVAQNPAKVNVPIIFTELGSDSTKGADNQAHVLVKAYTMGIAQGVACIQWFEGRDGDSGPMGLIDRQGNPRPSYTALGQMIKHLGQHPTYLGWVLLNDKDYGFVFQGEKGTVLSTWGPKGTTDRVDFGQQVQVVDPMTGKSTTATTVELTVAPKLILGVPEKLVTQAKENKGKRCRGEAIFRAAGEIGVDHVRREDGRARVAHTIWMPMWPRRSSAYGGSPRAGNVPGGSVFSLSIPASSPTRRHRSRSRSSCDAIRRTRTRDSS